MTKKDTKKKEMTMAEYKKKCFLGGITKSGKYKNNILANKLLKLPIYSFCYSNKNFLASITWDTEQFNDEFRVFSGKRREPSDLRRIAILRAESLDKNGWIENPSGMPEIPNSVLKLKDTKLAKIPKFRRKK